MCLQKIASFIFSEKHFDIISALMDKFCGDCGAENPKTIMLLRVLTFIITYILGGSVIYLFKYESDKEKLDKYWENKEGEPIFGRSSFYTNYALLYPFILGILL